jgi:2,5-furandicarboxylate decarboxylase 1
VRDFRSWIETLKERGALKVVSRQVDLRFELAAVAKKLDGRASVYFEKVGGHKIPVVANILFNREAVGEALRVPVARLVNRYLEAVSSPIPCKRVDQTSAPVKENKVRGDDGLDLGRLFPIPIHHEKDAGQFISAGVIVAKHPRTGDYNATICRLQMTGPKRLGICMQPRHLWQFYQEAEAKGEGLQVAIAIGVEPEVLLASQATVGIGFNELEIAGALKGEPLEVVQGETVDLLVPARAEIVVEGRILPFIRETEGPFGEYMLLYGPAGERQVIEVTAVTHRNSPIYHTIVPATMEHLLLGAIPREAVLFQMVSHVTSRVTAVHLTPGGSCRYHAVVALDKRREGEAKNIIFAAFASHENIKTVAVVDKDINIYNTQEVEWAISTRLRPETGVFVVPGAVGAEPVASSRARSMSAKMGIDATLPLDENHEDYEPIRIPGYDTLRLEDYIV